MPSGATELKAACSLVLLAVLWYAGRPGDTHEYRVTHVSLAETIALIDAGALVIDVRSAGTTPPGAVMIPVEVLAARLASMEVAKTQPIVYCGEGMQLGLRAAHALSQAGYTQVANLQSGIEGWRRAGLPVNPLQLLEQIQDAVEAAPVERARRLRAHHRLRAEGDRDAGFLHHLEVVRAVADRHALLARGFQLT